MGSLAQGDDDRTEQLVVADAFLRSGRFNRSTRSRPSV